MPWVPFREIHLFPLIYFARSLWPHDSYFLRYSRHPDTGIPTLLSVGPYGQVFWPRLGRLPLSSPRRFLSSPICSVSWAHYSVCGIPLLMLEAKEAFSFIRLLVWVYILGTFPCRDRQSWRLTCPFREWPISRCIRANQDGQAVFAHLRLWLTISLFYWESLF